MEKLRWDAKTLDQLQPVNMGRKIKQHRYEIMLGEELAYRSSEFLLGQAKIPFR